MGRVEQDLKLAAFTEKDWEKYGKGISPYDYHHHGIPLEIKRKFDYRNLNGINENICNTLIDVKKDWAKGHLGTLNMYLTYMIPDIERKDIWKKTHLVDRQTMKRLNTTIWDVKEWSDRNSEGG